MLVAVIVAFLLVAAPPAAAAAPLVAPQGDQQILPPVPPPALETTTIEASRDATLIEDPVGAFANGSGPVFFVGETGSAGARRAVLYFDVAGALPAGAVIDAAALTLYMTPSHDEPRMIHLHRVLAEWGEGPSVSSGGGGTSSLPGDATWVHTFYDREYWVHPGGQFVARASAELEVGAAGLYTWRSTDHLVQDVRLWQHAPDRNFGWILIGDESTPLLGQELRLTRAPGHDAAAGAAYHLAPARRRVAAPASRLQGHPLPDVAIPASRLPLCEPAPVSYVPPWPRTRYQNPPPVGGVAPAAADVSATSLARQLCVTDGSA